VFNRGKTVLVTVCLSASLARAWTKVDSRLRGNDAVALLARVHGRRPDPWARPIPSRAAGAGAPAVGSSRGQIPDFRGARTSKGEWRVAHRSRRFEGVKKSNRSSRKAGRRRKSRLAEEQTGFTQRREVRKGRKEKTGLRPCASLHLSPASRDEILLLFGRFFHIFLRSGLRSFAPPGLAGNSTRIFYPQLAQWATVFRPSGACGE